MLYIRKGKKVKTNQLNTIFRSSRQKQQIKQSKEIIKIRVNSNKTQNKHATERIKGEN